MNSGEQQAALERARLGDAEARGILLESFRPYVRCLLRALGAGRLRPRCDESDLIHDVLLEAHRGFDEFRGGTVAELTGWVRQITRRTAGHALRDNLDAGKRDLRREQPPDALADHPDPGSGPDAKVLRHELAARMARLLEQLPEDMQQVLLGRHVEGLAYAVLADRLGRTEGAVRVLYTRALRRLREAYQEGNSSHA
jgi:RNA polymerase sigma-70 factor (ECF subfamily)